MLFFRRCVKGEAGLTVVCLSVALLFSGCASYHALPLPEAASSVPLSSLVSHKLDMQQVSAMAMARSPSLQAAWRQVEVARRKADVAGYFPYPALSLSLDHPFSGPDHLDAWSLGVTESVRQLLTHHDDHRAADARYAASLLAWQWQRIQIGLKARCAYLDVWQAEQTLRLLGDERRLVEELRTAAAGAHARGDMKDQDYLAILDRAETLQSQLSSARAVDIQARNELAALLDITELRGSDLRAPIFPSPEAYAVDQSVRSLAERRLDLLALKAGYQSQDAQLRADILSQFPIVSIGFQRTNDTAGVNTVGLGVTVNLPFFNDSRGKIVIDRATREALRAAYQARLDQAVNEVRKISEKLAVEVRQQPRLRENAMQRKTLSEAADRAFQQGDITLTRQVALRLGWVDARLQSQRLQTEARKLAMTLSVLLAHPETGSTERIAAELIDHE